MKAHTIPVEVDAVQWNPHIGHPAAERFRGELSNDMCDACGKPLWEHGLINTPQGKWMVCPGEWIITHANGTHSVCSNTEFVKTYKLDVEQEVPKQG